MVLAVTRRRKIDTNQPDIVEALRLMGCTVAVTSRLGDGFPDLVVRKGSAVRLVEVKDGSKPPSARRLTGPEEQFRAEWAPVYEVVESVDQAVALARDMR